MKHHFLNTLMALAFATTVGAAPVRIAVFDLRATGGQGAGIDGLVRGLAADGWDVIRITDLDVLALLSCDVLYLSDVHNPGNVHADWRRDVERWVRAGGCVLQTWHHHILGSVGVGIQRVYGSRRMHVVPGHSAVQGVNDFDASFEDHIYERVGPAGQPLLKDEAGHVVAAAGALGRGKVISTGLALAIPNGRTTSPPRGPERKLLQSFLHWLTPTVSRADRMAALLTEPRLLVRPARACTAAGRPAKFRATVGSPEPVDVQLTAPGGTVERLDSELPQLQNFTITVTTETDESSPRPVTVRATVGRHALEETVQVDPVSATAPPNEMRGVWLHVAPEKHPRKVMPELKSLGINAAVLRIAGGTAAWYGSKVQPDVFDPLAPDSDWLAETVRYGRANGVAIHPYVNVCVVEGRTSPESLARLRAEGRLQEGPDGRPIDWFCPSQEINLQHMEAVMVELSTRYPVAGVQYDFIRYPNANGCFCSKCRDLFEKETGRAVAHWPQDVIDGPRHGEWVEFRCRRISALVRRTSNHIRREAPGVKISAAVFSAWPDCRETVGQDWVRWCREGWLDFVCPMNYTLDAELFAQRCAVHRQALPAGFPLVEGIGIASGAGRMQNADEVAVQIALARRNGAAGWLGFCYQPDHTTRLFGPLRSWMTNQGAD